MLLAHVELLVNQHPQVLLLLRAALNPFSTQLVFVLASPTSYAFQCVTLLPVHITFNSHLLRSSRAIPSYLLGTEFVPGLPPPPVLGGLGQTETHRLEHHPSPLLEVSAPGSTAQL